MAHCRCREQPGSFIFKGTVGEEVNAKQGYPGGFAAGILVDRQGTVWVKTASGALLFLPHGETRLRPTSYVTAPSPGLAYLHQAPDGSVWLPDKEGLRRLTDRSTSASTILPPLRKGHRENTRFGDFTFTPDGSVWAVADDGLARFPHIADMQASIIGASPQGEDITPKQGLSSNAVWKVFTDREGNVWVATNSGLDRFRRTALSTLVLPPSHEYKFAIAAGDPGSVWTGNGSLSLIHATANGSITTFPDIRQTICIRRDRNGTIWAAGRGSLSRQRLSETKFVAQPYPNQSVVSVVTLAVDRNNDLWISTPGDGTYQLVHGSWVNQNHALGKTPRVLGTMTGDDAGNVWLASPISWCDGMETVIKDFHFLMARSISPSRPWQYEASCMACRKRRRGSVYRDPLLPDALEGPRPPGKSVGHRRDEDRRPLEQWVLRHYACLGNRIG